MESKTEYVMNDKEYEVYMEGVKNNPERREN